MPFEKDEQQNVAALINRAQALIDIRRWQEALKLLRQALVIAPDSGDILCRVSYVNLQIGEFEQALAYADRAVQSEPMNNWGHRLRNYALLNLGKQSDALRAAEEAVRLAPGSPETFYSLADAQIANQMLSEARQSALRAREIAPESLESHRVLASVEMRHKSWSEAEKHLRKALSLNPTLYNALNDLGVCLFKQKQEREAVEMFRQAARANPAGKDAHYNLKISIIAHPVPGKLLVLILCPLTISAIARGRIWLSIIAILVLLLMTCVMLGFILSHITSLRSQAFKQLPSDAQNFIRAEIRRERGHHVARLVCGLSAIILMWWVAIRMLSPAPIFPRGVTSWAIFASMWACFGASAAILVRRATSSHTSLWKWFLGFESNG